MTTTTVTGLTVTGLTVGYGADPVITDMDFTVPHGRFTAIIGPNGCGKSTLIKSLSRVLPTTPGMVRLDGARLHAYRPQRLAQRIALLPQHPTIPDGVTVRSLVARGRYPYHRTLRQWAPTVPCCTHTGLRRWLRRLPCCRTTPASRMGCPSADWWPVVATRTTGRYGSGHRMTPPP